MITLSNGQKVGLGRKPDVRTEDDYTEQTVIPKKVSVPDMLSKFKLPFGKSIPTKTKNRVYCPPIVNQRELGSCTGRTMYYDTGYFIKRTKGKDFHASALFNYKCSRWLLNLKGDTGSTGSASRDAQRKFGALELKYHHDNNDRFDEELTAMQLAVADNYESLKWFRLDPPKINRQDLLQKAKEYIADGIPVAAAIQIRSSMELGDSPGAIPVPLPSDALLGLHEVSLMDYDDNKVICNTKTNIHTKGAFIFPNSWGEEWGDDGWGCISYHALLQKWIDDLTVMLQMEYAESDNFGC